MPQVLIVEDNATIARLLYDVFTLRGYSPLVARSADEALSHLATAHPLFITLDLIMPGSSGESLLQLLRSQPQTATLPVIVITSYLPVEPEVELLADAVLEKPFDLDDLLDAVQHVTLGALRERHAGA